MNDILRKIILYLLTLEAKQILKKYKPRIIAVTGSVGKTSTKDAIYTILSEKYFTRKSEKSFNSEFGVPLTILGCPSGWNNPFIWARNLIEGLSLIISKSPYPEWLVLEVGADRPGDIKTIGSWLKPDIAVITALPDIPVHVEYFKSAAAVREEKKELTHALKADGILVLNKDDVEVEKLAHEFRNPVKFYGTIGGCDVRASHGRSLVEEGILMGYCFRLNKGKESFPVEIQGSVGRQLLYPATAAAVVGEIAGLSWEEIQIGARKLKGAPGRGKLLKGLKNTYIIDDTYNASPLAVQEALRTLEEAKAPGRKIAVLGDMMELGTYSKKAHEDVGAHAAKVVDMLFTVGIRARQIAEGALENGLHESKILQYEDAKRAGKELELKLKEGDIVLLKGSQSMRMERAVKEIMAEPERAKELLVRQEEEWEKR